MPLVDNADHDLTAQIFIIGDSEQSYSDPNSRRVGLLFTDHTLEKHAETSSTHGRNARVLAQLTGDLAHDLNNVLTVIRANTELLQVMLPETREELEDIFEASGRGAQLTQRLLALSKRQSPRARVLDLQELLIGMRPTLNRMIAIYLPRAEEQEHPAPITC